MPTSIALLRGINVSGQKIIRMADLRSLLSQNGFQNVRTYIQSGNVIFDHRGPDLPVLANRMTKVILEHYGFKVPILVLSPVEMRAALENHPFDLEPAAEPKRYYVSFLHGRPDPDRIAKLKAIDHSPETWDITGTALYFHSPEGMSNGKLHNNYFEKKLKVTATTRNWKTAMHLIGMAESD